MLSRPPWPRAQFLAVGPWLRDLASHLQQGPESQHLSPSSARCPFGGEGSPGRSHAPSCAVACGASAQRLRLDGDQVASLLALDLEKGRITPGGRWAPKGPLTGMPLAAAYPEGLFQDLGRNLTMDT